MIHITTTRQEAKDAAKQIHEWRKVNIQGYNATSWDNEHLPDTEFDILHKSYKENKWYVSLDNENCFGLDKIENLPDEWRKNMEEKVPIIKRYLTSIKSYIRGIFKW